MDTKHTMYGSTHTHFESQYDTGNVLAEMITNFYRVGAKKIVATEHGVFSSFEDLKDTLHYLQTDPKTVKKWQEAGLDVESIPEDYEMEIIPGIECYFGDEAAHLVLIAKDYEGYKYLCKIISESNENIQTKNGKPIVTLENLRNNIKEHGHITCTSACIAGPFGIRLGLRKYNLKEDIADLEKELNESGYLELTDFESFYESEKKRLRTVRPTKAAETTANKLFKKTGDNSLLLELEAKRAEFDQLNTWLAENENKYKLTVKQIQAMKRAVWSKKVNKLDEKRLELSNLEDEIESGELEDECKDLLQDFIEVFGKDDFYFELQGHYMENEKEIYNNLVKFAYDVGHPQFIASNDIHIGLTKDNPRYEDALTRRNVAKFLRYGSYFPETKDDREYTIKGDDELIEILSDELDGYNGISGKQIAETAVGNIKKSLEQCHVEFPKDEKYYPKFCDDENAEFEKKVREGIKQRFPDGFPDERYEKRLEYELNVIKTMGYAGYHLIVADYLTYGRLLGYLPTLEEVEKAPFSIEELDKYITEKGYPRIGYSIGPGRGSAVGSLCCYLMGITDINPIPYNLLFEREAA